LRKEGCERGKQGKDLIDEKYREAQEKTDEKERPPARAASATRHR
jgi:hypothetical protein